MTYKNAIQLAALLLPGGLIALGAYHLVSLALNHCMHNFGFPTKDMKTGDLYVTCFKCAKEYDYDWEDMKVGGLRYVRTRTGNPSTGARRLDVAMGQAKKRREKADPALREASASLHPYPRQ